MADNENSEQQANQEGEKPEENTADYWKAKYEDMRGHMRDWQSKAESNKSVATEYAQYKETTQAEIDKATKRAEKAEAKLADYEADQQKAGWRSAAAEKYGVPAELLHGDTEETINASAEALKAWGDTLKPKSYAPHITDPAGHPEDPKPSENAELLKQLFNNQ